LYFTPIEYDDECRRYHRKQERMWEQSRFIAASILNTVSKHPVKPQKLVPLSIDEVTREKKVNKKEMREAQKEFMKTLKDG